MAVVARRGGRGQGGGARRARGRCSGAVTPGVHSARAARPRRRQFAAILYVLPITHLSSSANPLVAVCLQVLRADAAGLFQFAAIVNINLAAVNLLPLPALDGGYLALLALEAARGGRKLPAAVEQGVMAGGFLLLTGLGLGLVVRDTINLL